MDAPAPHRPRLSQVLLGVFILWQLFFVLALNYTQIMLGPADQPLVRLPDEGPPGLVERAADLVRRVTQHWAQLTGQYQSWWLFAFAPHDSNFPLVELRWDDLARAPVRLHAFQEPTDPAAYFRAPNGGDRLFHYEMNVEITYKPWSRDPDKPVTDFDLGRWLERARHRWPAVCAYLRWRLELWQQENPGTPPPTEIRLYSRSYPTPPPGTTPWQRAAPKDRPIFRWRPGVPPAPGCAPLDVFDPRKNDFVPLTLGETP